MAAATTRIGLCCEIYIYMYSNASLLEYLYLHCVLRTVYIELVNNWCIVPVCSTVLQYGSMARWLDGSMARWLDGWYYKFLFGTACAFAVLVPMYQIQEWEGRGQNKVCNGDPIDV
jgi:hypothetical protein